jgi:hypothetical protein
LQRAPLNRRRSNGTDDHPRLSTVAGITLHLLKQTDTPCLLPGSSAQTLGSFGEPSRDRMVFGVLALQGISSAFEADFVIAPLQAR